MAEAATADGFSLSKTFKRANHWRHILMDISMIGMAVGALVATGGASGFLDPIWGWMKMHVMGIPELFSSGGEFLSNAFEQATQGTFFTGVETNMHGAGVHADPITYSEQGFQQAEQSADFWGNQNTQHNDLMLSHP